MKKKYLIFILIIILVVLLFELIYIFFFKDTTKKDIKQIENQIEEFLDLSYQYYLISEGPLEIGEGTIKLDDKVYYYVTNENFSSTNDIIKLTNKLISSKYSSLYIDKVYFNREFINTSSGLYVYFKTDPCSITYDLYDEKYDLTKQKDDEYAINYDSVGVTIVKEDGNWLLNTPLYFCEMPDWEEIEED